MNVVSNAPASSGVSPPRVFVIGFNRCGTTSLHEFFRAVGRRPVHCDDGRLAVTMERNAAAGRRLIAGYEDHDGYSDMYYACVHGVYEANRHFRLLAEQEPDALFILNVRDVERWVWSRSHWRDMGIGIYDRPDDMPCNPPCCRLELTEAHRRHWNLADEAAVRDHWREQWRHHLAAVRAELPAERLLVFDIEAGDPRDLCRFLGLPEGHARHWRQHNRSYLAPTTWGLMSARLPGPLRRLANARALAPLMRLCGFTESSLRTWLRRRNARRR